MHETFANRIGLTDFLGTLPGGFYTLVVLAYSLRMCGIDFDFNILVPVAGAGWFLTVCTLLGSFVIGSIYRAFPVRWLEKLTLSVFSEGKFPYPARIRRCVGILDTKASTCLNNSFDFNNSNVQMLVFDYWKAVLCCHSSSAFHHIKTIEAKVRFFVGMAWACIFGTVCIFGVTIAAVVTPKISWSIENNILFVSPVLFLFVIYSLVRAREEEVSEVVWVYAALVGDIESIDKK